MAFSNWLARLKWNSALRRRRRPQVREVLRPSYLTRQVDHLENRILLAANFGDAPIPYPVTQAENGAEHVATGPTLGARRDEESDGTHSIAADVSSDDDGIVNTGGVITVGQLDASVTVNVQNAPGGAKLDAWIDFNRDGTWGGPGEKIFDRTNVVNGNNVLSFDIPSWSLSGTTYARFRLSTAGDLGVGGPAPDGEVEDYTVEINPPVAAFGVFGTENVISADADGAHSVFAIDVDGDGDTDVLSASVTDNRITWYENDGSQTFTTHTITTQAIGAESVFAADVDGDGDIDALSASEGDDKIAWYENDGSQNFTERIISTTADGAQSVFAADIDGDGDMDVLSASEIDDKIAWYENDGSQSFVPHTITVSADNAFSVYAVDVDGDGDMDVLSASENDNTIAWYENDGNQSFTAHTISTTASAAQSVFAADVNGDGHMDVLSASRNDNKIAWYENDGSQNFVERVISTAAIQAHAVFAADLDGDGDIDALSASATDDKIAWYENNGNQNFTERIISSSASAAHGVFAADVNGDGNLDVLSASQNDKTIAWFENKSFDYGDAPTPYAVTLAEDGARHAAAGPSLGARRDGESDGIHSSAADADGADDDGVTYGVVQAGQLDAEVTVNVQDAPGSAKLDAWIDFNGDGNWGGPGEQIFDTTSVVNGNNVLRFDVPSWSISGTTYARFRLSTAGNLGLSGSSADGEVEDYAVEIDSPVAASGIFSDERIIARSVDGARSVFATDLDGDGDIDVLSASDGDHKISWYENDGNQSFNKRDISTPQTTGPFPTDTFRASDVFAVDVDGDGDLDVLSASSGDRKIAWFENDGHQNFTQNIISTDGASDVFAADVDEDGDMDIFSVNSSKLFENDGTQNFNNSFTGIPRLDAESREARRAIFESTLLFDIDGDGDMDEITRGLEWRENIGTGSFITNTIDSFSSSSDVFAADVDGDGDLDVLSADSATDKITWYENNATPTLRFLADVSIDEDATQQTVELLDIGPGQRESEPVRVNAFSSNAGLVPAPTVLEAVFGIGYGLRFAPKSNESGTATITVTVEDGGPDDNLTTAHDNATISRVFDVIVGAVNDVPTLNVIADLTINEDAPAQVVDLTGITAGTNESQPLRVTATSDNPSLVPHTIAYVSGESAGTFRFTPPANQSGTASVMVTVEDGGLDGNLNTTSDNATFSRTFDVTVNPVNDVPQISSASEFSVPEEFDREFALTISDPDPGQTHSFSLLNGGLDNEQFVLNASTGAWRFRSAPDFENPTDSDADNVYEVSIVVVDSELSGSVQTIRVTVTDENDVPVITSSPESIAHGATIAGPVVATDEDLPAQTVVYRISNGADSDQFTIAAGTGVLSFVSARDFGAPADSDANNIYEVVVEADDQAGGTTSQAIHVVVSPPALLFDADTGSLTVFVLTGQIKLSVDDQTDEVTVNSAATGILANLVQSVLVSGTTGSDLIDLEDISAATLPTLNAPVRVEAGDGDDTIFGSGTADIVLAGPGADVVHGNEGQNTLFGEAGDDIIFGGPVDDEIHGGDGNDFLLGMAGDDTQHGGNGNDIILGAAGSDLLSGDEGDDQLRGQGGSGDVLTGGPGADALDGGLGTDRVAEVFLAAAVIQLSGIELNADGDRDALGGIEQAVLTGGDGGVLIDTRNFGGDTTLNGGAGDDNLRSGDGQDILMGFAGNDVLDSGAGDDFLFGAAGRDILDGGPGNDLLKGQGSSGDQLTGGRGLDTIDGGTGNDRLVESFPASTNIGLTETHLHVDDETDELRSIEQAEIHGGDGGVTIDARSFRGSAALYGGAGIDRLFSGDNNDQLFGLAGDDILDSGSGNDWLLGAAGRDVLRGGDGDDILRGQGSSGDRLIGGLGADRLDGGVGSDLIFTDVLDTVINDVLDVIVTT